MTPATEKVVPFKRKKPRKAQHRARVVFLTADELQRLMKAAAKFGAREHLLTLLSYKHGLRASEVVNLKMQDIDRKTGQITIRRLKGSLTTVQPLMPHRGKPEFDEVRALKRWLEIRPEHAGDYLFASQKASGLCRETWFALFQKIAEQAGIPADKRFPHILKHTRASLLVQNGDGLMHVKQLLGHKSIASTIVYAQVSDQQAAEAAAKIDAEMF